MSSARRRHPRASFTDLSSLSTIVLILIGLQALFTLVSIGSSWMQLDLLTSPDGFTEEQGVANDRREFLAGLVVIAVGLISGVVFLRWLYLGTKNRSHSVPRQRSRPAGLSGGSSSRSPTSTTGSARSASCGT